MEEAHAFIAAVVFGSILLSQAVYMLHREKRDQERGKEGML
jgi:hypothetical protein